MTSQVPGMDLPAGAAPDQQQFNEAVRENIEVLAGNRGDPRARALTVADLERAGLVRVTIKGGYAYVTAAGGAFTSGGSGGGRRNVIDPSSIPLFLELSRTAVALISYADGTVASFAAANGLAKVYFGNLDVTASAVLSFEATNCTGTLNVSTDTPVAGQPKGYYEVTALSDDWGELTIRASYGSLTATRKFVVTRVNAGFEIVTELPTDNLFEGRIVYLETNGKLYVYHDGEWTAMVPDSAGIPSGDNLPPSGSEGDFFYNETDGKLYRYHDGEWTAAVDAADIVGTISAAQIGDGEIGVAKFASGIEPVSVVSSLPNPSGYTGPKVVLLTTDGKLYRYSGSAWTAAVAATDLSGSIGGGNLVLNSDFSADTDGDGLSDSWTGYGSAPRSFSRTTTSQGNFGYYQNQSLSGSGTYGLRQSGGVTWTGGETYVVSCYMRATGAIVGQQPTGIGPALSDVASGTWISRPALTGNWQRYIKRVKLVASPATPNDLYIHFDTPRSSGDLNVDRVQVELGEVATAYAPRPDEILPGTIGTTQIADGAITTPKIIAGAVVTGHMAANSINGDRITVNTLNGDRITSNSITAGQIAAGAIGVNELAAGAVRTDKLLVAVQGASLNLDPNFADPSAWTLFNGSAAVFTAVTDGAVGNTVARSGTPNAAGTWLNGAQRIPIDASKTYRVRAWARRNSTANGTLYIGVAAFDAAGANINGDGAQWSYDAALGVSASTSWTAYSGLIGAGTANPFPPNARTMSPLVILNYASSAGFMECQDLRIEEVLPGTLIQDGAITTNKIGANQIIGAHIAGNTITGDKIIAGQITGSHIAGSTITGGNIAGSTITGDKIQAGTLVAAHLQSNTITAASGVIANGAITSAKIADAAITNAKIGNLEVDSAKIANLTIGTGKIVDDAITASAAAYTVGNTATVGVGTPQLAQSVSITTNGGGRPVLILAGFSYTTTTGIVTIYPIMDVRREDGTQPALASNGYNANIGTLNAMALDFPPAGPHTYTVTASSSSGQFFCHHRVLVAIELKK